MTELPESPRTVGEGPGDASAGNGEITLDAGELQPAAEEHGPGPEQGPGASAGVVADTSPPGPGSTEPERPAAFAARFAGGWPLGRIIGVGILIAGLFSVLAIVVGAVALTNLNSARSQVVDTLDPASFHASQLEVALLNQETGVRGYVLTRQQSFLEPYRFGLAQQARQVSRLRPLLSGIPAAQADLAKVLANVNTWRSNYAEPTITHVSTSGKPVPRSAMYQGKADFDTLRATLNSLQVELASQRILADASLNRSVTVL